MPISPMKTHTPRPHTAHRTCAPHPKYVRKHTSPVDCTMCSAHAHSTLASHAYTNLTRIPHANAPRTRTLPRIPNANTLHPRATHTLTVFRTSHTSYISCIGGSPLYGQSISCKPMADINLITRMPS